MKTLLLMFGIFVMVVTGCATTTSHKASIVQDADQEFVKNCVFVGSVSGTSGWGNLAASTGINNAKNEAREQAARLNATHLVWTSVIGGYSPNVSGNAYQCK